MTEQQTGLISLIRSALTGQACFLPASFDLPAALHEAKRHGIIALAFYGACHCGVDPSCEEMKTMFSLVCKCIAAAGQQDAEISILTETLEAHGIEYMPLKGALLRKVFPKPEMRMMGDVDILIKTEQYPAIRPLMLELEYEESVVSDHEFNWHKPSLHVELHRRLIPSYNKDYYAYFGDGWKLASRIGTSCRFHMSPEDELIYLFTHFAKHYRDSGIGLRHPLDIWAFEQEHPDLNRAYLQTELTKLQLWDFYCNVHRTLDVWFRDAAPDEITDAITDTIFHSGQYGRRETSQLSSSLKERKNTPNSFLRKIKQLSLSVFTPYETMCKRYPVLVRHPYLLPFFWVVFFFRRLTNRERMTAYAERQHAVTTEQVSAYQQALNQVGLDFNFGDGAT